MTTSTNFKKPPPVNVVSKGAAAFENAQISRTYSVYDLVGTGTPVDGTSGTGAGFAGPGSRYTDIATPKMYINGGAGTKLSPVWKLVTSAA
jgi:hypothetical protein